MKTVLITGGSGFIGTHLVEYFRQRDCSVWNLDIAPPRNPDHATLWKPVDLLDRQNLIDNLRSLRPDTLIHCAARTDLREKANLDGYRVNFEGICHLIEAIRAASSIQRAVFFSTQLVCHLGYKPSGPEDYSPATLYGRSKVLMEKTLRAAGDLGAIWTIVRPTSIWGPWFDEPYRDFFRIIRRGLYIQPKGIITRKQWGFVGNTVFQVQSLLQAPAESVHTRLFYLADYEPLVLSNFAVQVQAAFSAPHVRELPLSVLKVLARMGDTIRLLGWQNPPLSTFRLGNILAEELQDIAPLETIAGPLPFSVAAGIRQTVRWMEEADGKGKSS